MARRWRPQLAVNMTRIELEAGFSVTAHLVGGNKGYLNPWGVSRGFQGECPSLAGAKVLEMLYLREEEFQVFAEHDLIRRGSLTWLPGYMTT